MGEKGFNDLGLVYKHQEDARVIPRGSGFSSLSLSFLEKNSPGYRKGLKTFLPIIQCIEQLGDIRTLLVLGEYAISPDRALSQKEVADICGVQRSKSVGPSQPTSPLYVLGKGYLIRGSKKGNGRIKWTLTERGRELVKVLAVEDCDFRGITPLGAILSAVRHRFTWKSFIIVSNPQDGLFGQRREAVARKASLLHYLHCIRSAWEEARQSADQLQAEGDLTNARELAYRGVGPIVAAEWVRNKVESIANEYDMVGKRLFDQYMNLLVKQGVLQGVENPTAKQPGQSFRICVRAKQLATDDVTKLFD